MDTALTFGLPIHMTSDKGTRKFYSGANFRENYVNIQRIKIKEMKPLRNGRGKFFYLVINI